MASKTAMSKFMFVAGWIITSLPILLMGVLGTYITLFKPEVAADGMKQGGYPASLGTPIFIVEMICLVIYIIPQTAVLGAILLTAYLGGATATHVRVGQPFYLPVIVGVLVWLGLFLRDARIRALVPWRR